MWAAVLLKKVLKYGKTILRRMFSLRDIQFLEELSDDLMNKSMRAASYSESELAKSEKDPGQMAKAMVLEDQARRVLEISRKIKDHIYYYNEYN